MELRLEINVFRCCARRVGLGVFISRATVSPIDVLLGPPRREDPAKAAS